MAANMRKISLQESRDMSLKLENLLAQEARINTRKTTLVRENKVELERCLEEQEKVREIIRTGEINEDEVIQEEMFDDDDTTTSFNVTITFSSMNSGMPLCEIQLQDMLNLQITPEVKGAIRTSVNHALFEVRQQSMGYRKIMPAAVVPQLVEQTGSEAGEVADVEHNEVIKEVFEAPNFENTGVPTFSMNGAKPGRKAKMKAVQK